jgi:hypothetical protein
MHRTGGGSGGKAATVVSEKAQALAATVVSEKAQALLHTWKSVLTTQFTCTVFLSVETLLLIF